MLRGPSTPTSWSTTSPASGKAPSTVDTCNICVYISTLPSPDGMRQIAALFLKSPVPAWRLLSAWRSETLSCLKSRVLPIGHGAEIAKQPSNPRLANFICHHQLLDTCHVVHVLGTGSGQAQWNGSQVQEYHSIEKRDLATCSQGQDLQIGQFTQQKPEQRFVSKGYSTPDASNILKLHPSPTRETRRQNSLICFPSFSRATHPTTWFLGHARSRDETCQGRFDRSEQAETAKINSTFLAFSKIIGQPVYSVDRSWSILPTRLSNQIAQKAQNEMRTNSTLLRRDGTSVRY